MKNLLLLMTLGLISLPAHADGEWSTNVGWVSEYIFRGIPQDDSSAYVGLDYENNGFYLGSWAADVGQGAEVDFYFGYGGSVSDNFSYGIGATGYFYTDDFDDTYREINLSLAYDFLSFDVAAGEYDNFDGPTLDYSFSALTGEYKDFYALVGLFGGDFDGEYFEAGYGTEIGGFDVSVAVIHSRSNLLGESDNSIVLGIGRSFSFEELGLFAAAHNPSGN